MAPGKSLPEDCGLVEQARGAADEKIKDSDVYFAVMSVMIPYHFGSNGFTSTFKLAKV
jgi:hypothetical protein